MHRLIVAIAVLLAAGPEVSSGGVPPELPIEGATRVVVEAEVWGEGRTPAEARREALERARALAVERVTGIRVSAQELRLRAEGADGAPVDAFASLVRTLTWGRIARESAVHETAIMAGVPVYRVRLEAEVVVEQGEPDPGFTLAIASRPDTHTFRDGEALALELTASRDCFVHLFNVLPDGRVVPLDAAADRRPVRLEAGRRVRLPEPGTVLRAQLGSGLARAHEQVLAIGTLDALPLPPEPTGPGERSSDSGTLLGGDTGGDMAETWNALNRWLLGIPIDRRTEALWSYEVLP